jgi:hypothetical protein
MDVFGDERPNAKGPKDNSDTFDDNSPSINSLSFTYGETEKGVMTSSALLMI